MSLADVKEVVEYMRKEDRAEWVAGKGAGGEGGNEVWIWWRTPEEWATAVYEWVSSCGGWAGWTVGGFPWHGS